jgi:hypothetical protein
MKSDIALAIIGALIGVTIGQLQGDVISTRLAKFFKERVFKYLGISLSLGKRDTPSE